MRWVLATVLGCLVSTSALADGQVSLLTYNVAGLPAALSSGNPATNTALISPLLNAYDLVNVQEDFNYHQDLIGEIEHTYLLPFSGVAVAGDGLNTFAFATVGDFTRVTWDECYGFFTNGADCLTPKGFSRARVYLSGGARVDLYNVHADAGTDSGSNAARAANLLQLLDYIEEHSAGYAVIVAGDLNSRYTRATDVLHDYIAAGFEDAWVEVARAGVYPVSGAPALTDCTDKSSGVCERVDKVLYRSSADVSLAVLDSYVPSNFVDASGAELSDHDPVLAVLEYAYTGQGPGVDYSSLAGGSGGVLFDDLAALVAHGFPALTQVRLRSGSRVDSVGFSYEDGLSVDHGGTGGGLQTLSLQNGEFLTEVTACANSGSGISLRIYYMEVRTNLGQFLSGGTYGGSCSTWTAPAGAALVGAFGRAGSELDRVGVITAY